MVKCSEWMDSQGLKKLSLQFLDVHTVFYEFWNFE
jgi:hypothetical protein